LRTKQVNSRNPSYTGIMSIVDNITATNLVMRYRSTAASSSVVPSPATDSTVSSTVQVEASPSTPA
jgi:hypothetical protein